MVSEIKDIDLIIVGSGPGGATVAKEMAKRKKKILIIEWGDNEPLNGTFSQTASTLLVPGKGMLFTPQMLTVFRSITTGGSTVHYYATAFPIPVDMFKSYGIDLSDENNEITRELPIAPLKDEMVGPMARKIMESAQNLGYKWEKLNKFMYQDKWKPEYAFGHYGDPNGVKWSARMYVQEALRYGAKLINHAKAEKVLLEGNKAVGVEYERKKIKCKIYASKVVLSAGGIGTPVILRRSGIKRAGYDYFFDPLIGVRGTVKDIEIPNSEIPMTAGVQIVDDGYMMTDMAYPLVTNALFSAGAFRFDKMFSRQNTLQIMVKARDDLGGKLTDRGGVRKVLDKNEKEKLKKGFERAKKILQNAGAKDIYQTRYLAAHPGGTVKIGDLVDSNLMTQYDNLYVCDSSVIPEAWGLPPTYTIVALAKRLAKHLA